MGTDCDFLEFKDIPRALLPPRGDETDTDDEMDTDEAIGILTAYAFIMQREVTDKFDIYLLVRLVIQNWLQGQGEEEEQVTETIHRLSTKFLWPDHENREIWMAYLPVDASADTGAEEEGARTRESLHTYQHRQPGRRASKTREVRRGRADVLTDTRAKGEGAGAKPPFDSLDTT
ncbi:kinesin light chain [Colletotrichum incanum]|uniref:Kinesin light chain n=1 Tax=Colletotrichum incanum TaxID=1573173 RepID=A0A166N2V3_COLIC|nr:kinesin light chain [Colletotrichum incanum]